MHFNQRVGKVGTEFPAQLFVSMSEDRDFDQEEADLIKQRDDLEESEGEEPYRAPHCSDCHDSLGGVGAKAHKKGITTTTRWWTALILAPGGESLTTSKK